MGTVCRIALLQGRSIPKIPNRLASSGGEAERKGRNWLLVWVWLDLVWLDLVGFSLVLVSCLAEENCYGEQTSVFRVRCSLYATFLNTLERVATLF